MKETVVRTESGAILYDQSLINQISDASFTPESWQAAVPVKGRLRSAGRGNTMFVSDGNREFVLRHYVRGGLIGRVNHDRYLWLGEKRNRAFAEWRLLAKLTAMGLPVPQPAAARYERSGLCYTADLLTVNAPGIEPLSARIADNKPAAAEFWRGIGKGIRRFHDGGVCHADLNAYNVQVTGNDAVFLLDFDRGRIRPPGAWQQQNLSRLHRSLQKIKELDPQVRFEEEDWRELVDAYEDLIIF